jgi:hypothetical protein
MVVVKMNLHEVENWIGDGLNRMDLSGIWDKWNRSNWIGEMLEWVYCNGKRFDRRVEIGTTRIEVGTNRSKMSKTSFG